MKPQFPMKQWGDQTEKIIDLALLPCRITCMIEEVLKFQGLIMQCDNGKVLLCFKGDNVVLQMDKIVPSNYSP
jgi:predicted methyltransferase